MVENLLRAGVAAAERGEAAHLSKLLRGRSAERGL
jgi:hypothetical protein